MEEQKFITTKNLTEEIYTILKDEFIAKLTKNENFITLDFLNGQKFIVLVEEVNNKLFS